MVRVKDAILRGLTWCLAGLVGCGGLAQAGQLLNATFDARDYPGSRDRQYQLYIPDRYDGTVPVPLLMVLHGCNQTERNMVEETRFNALAEQHNFIVVYPFITSYTGLRNANCWGFWFEPEIHEGGGEAEDLHQLARSIE